MFEVNNDSFDPLYILNLVFKIQSHKILMIACNIFSNKSQYIF